MIGAMDNGIILYVGEKYCSYFPYATWRLAKHTQTSMGSLFDVLCDLVKYGGIAKSYKQIFDEAAESVSKSVSLNFDSGNHYFPIPDGTNVKLREGRHGSAWGLYDACLCTGRMLGIFCKEYIFGARVIPFEFE